MSNIVYRPIETAAEVRECERIQQSAWGMTDLGVMPYNAFHAIIHANGLLIGAFDGDTLIAFACSFLGEIDGKKLHWSHLMAVVPEYQRQGIGTAIKFAQRKYLLERGINRIAWTFDPLRYENAVFNINILGAIPQKLLIEQYGQMTDSINAGLLSDRFETHWELNNKVVKKIANGQYKPLNILNFTYVTRAGNSTPILTLPKNFTEPYYAVQLPLSLNKIREQSAEQAKSWYYAVRDSTQPLFDQHYEVVQVQKQDHTFAYIFQRPEDWFLYIAETADNTLYTGITNNLENRIAIHNTGKGAKYTRMRRPVTLQAAWQTLGRSKATKLEYQLKSLTRQQKLALIESQQDFESAKRYR